MKRLLLIVTALIFGLTSASRAEPFQLIGAGSLTIVMSDIIRRFPAGLDNVLPAEFGPSGLMRQKIEAGAMADIFASADMAHARALAAGIGERVVINFTRNQLCALARPGAGLATETMLDRLLDPAVRVATSTPGADPGGDYAWAVFARADALRPGARAILEKKALPLVGGGERTPLLVPGKGAVEGVFLADKADVMLGYCSSGDEVRRALPDLVNVKLPDGLAVGPAYGMVLMNAKPVTLRFAAFVMSETGQSVLKDYGFDPVGYTGPVPPAPGVLVQRRGAPARLVATDRLAVLAPFTQTLPPAPGHGNGATAWTGPLLWDVLTAAGAIDPTQPAGQVRLAVRVTGADGYVATIALAELSPEFAGRPIQLATHMNGVALAEGGLRLVVPGDKRGGRSVRDVVRIDIE